jgi:NAD(P)-dependent dehydrogenase (short-subunit alcohol dehydrogenase family)
VRSLTGKAVVVTGAARGFGFALASAFAEAGMSAVLADVDEAGLEAAVGRLRESGAEAVGVPTDVSDPSAVDQLRDIAFERFGTVHVLCNNAMAGGGGSLCEPVDVAEWERVFRVGLFGALHGVNAFLPRMLEQGEGHIVNTASRQGLVPAPHLGGYPPMKSALIAYSEMLREELAERQAPVGVTVLTPGGIRTEALLGSLSDADRPENEDPALREFLMSRVAAAVEPIELARLAVRAVETDVLYVNSHRETLEWLQLRVDRMSSDADRIGTLS